MLTSRETTLKNPSPKITILVACISHKTGASRQIIPTFLKSELSYLSFKPHLINV